MDDGLLDLFERCRQNPSLAERIHNFINGLANVTGRDQVTEYIHKNMKECVEAYILERAFDWHETVYLANGLQNNTNLRSLIFIECDFPSDGIGLLLDALEQNTVITHVSGSNELAASGKCSVICRRNKDIRHAICTIVFTIIAARKFDRGCLLNVMAKEIVLDIAKRVWETRTDECWLEVVGEKSGLSKKIKIN